MKIIPTVGRVVWYHPGNYTNGMTQYNAAQPMDAHIVYVWGDDMVNLLIVDHAGVTHERTSVPLVQEGSQYIAGPSPYCEWMPYQKGQAAKQDAKADTNKAVSNTDGWMKLECLRSAIGVSGMTGVDPIKLAAEMYEFITR